MFKSIISFLGWLPTIWADITKGVEWLSDKFNAWKEKQKTEEIQKALDKTKKDADTRDLEKSITSGSGPMRP